MKNTQDQFYLLKEIKSNPNISQREMANQLNISLGKINYTLLQLKKRGLVKLKYFKKNKNKMHYMYFLTPKGISEKTKITVNFMKQRMAGYEELRKEIKNDKKL